MTKRELKENWVLSGYDSSGFTVDRIWKNCGTDSWETSVPADVHTILMKNRIIEDPVISINDQKTAWVEEKVWVYHTVFEVKGENVGASELIFEGLDTYAEVYLNRQLLARYQNMFMVHKADTSDLLKVGNNELDIVFYPVKEEARKKLPEGFWTNYSTERAFARKPGYHFGWDWTPRVATVGIWRPVYLAFYSVSYIESIQVLTESVEEDHSMAQLLLSVRTKDGVPCHAAYMIRDHLGKVVSEGSFSSSSTQKICVENPKLWWTADQGEPYLYELEISVSDENGNLLDTALRRFGIRTIRIEKKCEGEKRFCFLLNGRRVFLKGANWVPVSNRLAAASDSWYQAILDRALSAHMNTLCIWGGGIYENPVFYDYCDEHGILVWQYFMFACGEYPGYDPEYVENVRKEVLWAAGTLASHACMALWIGNVEVPMICQKIKLDREMYGKKMFAEQIPEWLHSIDPTAEYIESSPIGTGFYNSMDEGDRHNWDVWFSDLPYEEYTKDTGRFLSEFGIHAAPEKQTIVKYTGDGSITPESFRFRYFNKDADPDRLNYYFNHYTGMPANMDEYIDYSMLIQADALEMACGHFRHRFPRCGGALIWQLNDCCGVQSWSMVDYDNIPKASWYRAREFFSDVAVYLEHVSENKTNIWVMNQSGNASHVQVEIELGDFLGMRGLQEVEDVMLQSGECRLLKVVEAGGRFYPNVILSNRQRFYYLSAHIKGHTRRVMRYFVPFKKLLLPPTELDVQEMEEEILIHSDRLAFFVHAEGDLAGIDLEDNYFDILPGETKRIRYQTADGCNCKKHKIHWTSLNPMA